MSWGADSSSKAGSGMAPVSVTRLASNVIGEKQALRVRHPDLPGFHVDDDDERCIGHASPSSPMWGHRSMSLLRGADSATAWQQRAVGSTQRETKENASVSSTVGVFSKRILDILSLASYQKNPNRSSTVA